MNLDDLISDIQKQYTEYRKSGKNRADAVETILKYYAEELQDDDDRVTVLIGISAALCKKSELYEPIASETLLEIRKTLQKLSVNTPVYRKLVDVELKLTDQSVYGEESVYKRTRKYVPAWKVGDTFAHKLTFPASEGLGIKDWFIILHKVGEHIDELGLHRQLMYVTLCPPDKIPTSSEDLQQLGVLPMMRMGNNLEFLVQLSIKSKRAENMFELSWIGCFENVSLPSNILKENPLTAMPLLSNRRPNTLWPIYEDQICRLYKKFGTILNIR